MTKVRGIGWTQKRRDVLKHAFITLGYDPAQVSTPEKPYLFAAPFSISNDGGAICRSFDRESEEWQIFV